MIAFWTDESREAARDRYNDDDDDDEHTREAKARPSILKDLDHLGGVKMEDDDDEKGETASENENESKATVKSAPVDEAVAAKLADALVKSESKPDIASDFLETNKGDLGDADAKTVDPDAPQLEIGSAAGDVKHGTIKREDEESQSISKQE